MEDTPMTPAAETATEAAEVPHAAGTPNDTEQAEQPHSNS